MPQRLVVVERAIVFKIHARFGLESHSSVSPFLFLLLAIINRISLSLLHQAGIRRDGEIKD
jgi:hypothetical protein